MPMKPKKPCKHPGCPALTDKTFCEEHKQAEDKRYNHYERDPNSNKRYGRRWKQIRAAFLSEHPLCEMCLQGGRLIPADTVHHKRSLKDGGGNDKNNLQALCHSCHSRLHTKQRDCF